MDPHQGWAAMLQIAHAESHDLFGFSVRRVGKTVDPELAEAGGKIRLRDLSKLGCRGHD